MSEKYAILRVEKLKGGKGESALSHIRREYDIKTLTNPGSKNYYIRPPETKKDKGKKFNELLEERLKPGYKYRRDAVKGFHFLISFSPGALKDPKDIMEWAKTSVEFFRDKFGADNFVESVLHTDESSLHIHCIVTCIDEGKLKSKNFINGPEQCRQLQTDYAAAVARFGLERGVDKRITKKKHKHHLKWIAENAQNRAKLDAYEKTYGTVLDMDTKAQEAFLKALKEAFEEPAEPKQAKENNIEIEL